MTESADAGRAATMEDALHATLDMPFDEAVDSVQLEHELAGFETIKTTRMDRLVKGALEEDVERAALIVMCHAEVARDALEIDRTLAAMLPCTTAVYEVPGDERVHVRHVSVTKAMRDLGAVPDEADALDDLIELTGDRMTEVWSHVEALAGD
jgi:uncharacterized protein (DUF302 family)